METKEWYDPDIIFDIPRWNHSAIMVEAIPSWKYFIFGGEVGDFPEGGPRHFGVQSATAAYLDIESMNWTTMDPEDLGEPGHVVPLPREYSSMIYDDKGRRIICYAGWNNEWYDDLCALNVSKIVGPSYAITEIIPNLGQLSGKSNVVIKGCGFREATIKVFFTCGKVPVDLPNKMSKEGIGCFVSETEMTCETPSYEEFGPKEAIVQLQIQGGDLTTTYQTFSFFMNTRAMKSLAYGPGLLEDGAIGTPTEFIIQARNDLDENRKSGRDNFQVKIMTVGDDPQELQSEVTDKDNGQYLVSYTATEVCQVSVAITFEDDKGKMVPIRGSPYKATFSAKASANANNLTGPAMQKHIAAQLEDIHTFIMETTKGASTKDKSVKEDVKALIAVKDHVENVFQKNDEIILQMDCLDESLKTFQENGISKESQLKGVKKLFEEWGGLKKLAKETKKEITPIVQNESEKTSFMIRKLEDELKDFTTGLKKRQFYKYDAGVPGAKEKLEGINNEIKGFEDRISDYGYSMDKFGNADLINNSNRSVDFIKQEVANMVMLWEHIECCQDSFKGYMEAKWVDTNPGDMEEEVKKLMK